MSSQVEILDCTLRDGGYIIDWKFGQSTIEKIVDCLTLAGIDYIECGFLKEEKFNPDKTFFPTLKNLLPFLKADTNYTLMVNFGEYSIDNFPKEVILNIVIRVAFKKHNKEEALKYIEKLVDLGWKVFANPMSTNSYSEQELETLINKINQIKPFALSIVDTLGNMYEKDVVEIFEFIDKILDKNIALGFHSHNSMQLSFSNTKALLKMDLDRKIIIDSCVYGMGRGAGNLCTELITKYLNDNWNKEYKILSVLKAIEILKPIYDKTPWGYSTPYYISAIYGCHPNYASYLVNQQFPDNDIEKIMSKIPEDKKLVFDKDFIENFIKDCNKY